LKIKKYDIILFCSWVWWSVFFCSPVVQIGQSNVQNVSENVYVYNKNVDITISARDAMQLH